MAALSLSWGYHTHAHMPSMRPRERPTRPSRSQPASVFFPGRWAITPTSSQQTTDADPTCVVSQVTQWGRGWEVILSL